VTTPVPRGRWVCLDVGETLIDETRVWDIWADLVGIPRFTFMAAYGAGVERGPEHGDVFRILGVDAWRDLRDQVEERYGCFVATDLYPDARRSVDGLQSAGYRVAIVANQPARRTQELHELGIEAEVMAMSEELGVAKPDPAFFQRALELMGSPDPREVAYVGDRLDNDVGPSAAAGMRAVWMRRGPWGIIPKAPTHGASLVVSSLDELVTEVWRCWPPLSAAPGTAPSSDTTQRAR
jgi:HAD superfamily hydrolase (TIGR01662 family)